VDDISTTMRRSWTTEGADLNEPDTSGESDGLAVADERPDPLRRLALFMHRQGQFSGDADMWIESDRAQGRRWCSPMRMH
jgi:hypothetical protein